MSRPVTPLAGRIALHLDFAVAFEALLLNRLEQMPAGRREEWLRGLLVRGFLSECESLKSVAAPASHRGHARAPARTCVPADSRPAEVAEQPKPATGEPIVTFADLQRVIG